MKKITKEELHEILRLHKMWIKKEKGGVRADLSYLDLSGSYLRFANLSFAKLNGSDLTNADLSFADLECVNLSNSNLNYVNLSYSFLHNANLKNALLYMADLNNACLTDANLHNAKLRNVNLSYADLTNSNLEFSDLTGANLSYAVLDEEEQIRKGIILDEPMIGYKKCRNNTIVTLEIPKGATVFSINNYRRRTNKAKVIEIGEENTEATIYYDENFTYHVGENIEIKDFDLIYNVEHANGIYFFSAKKEAIDYKY